MHKYELGLYEKAMPDISWQEKLAAAKAAGFDYVEISVDETEKKLARLDYSDSQIDEIRQACLDHNILLKSMCLSGHRKFPLGDPDPQKRQQSLLIMEKAINLCCKLGIRIIQLAGYDTYYDEGTTKTEKYFRDNLQIATEMAALKGVVLGFETMETPFMDTVGKAMHYVKLIDNPYLGVYPDIGNLENAALKYQHRVVDDLAQGQGHLFAAHLKETIPNHYREIPFGTGHTDYLPSIQELWRQGVRTFVGEFWFVGSENWRDDLTFANQFLRDKINSAISSMTC